MKDFATSSDAAVQAQLDRLAALSVPDGRLGLEAIRTLLARLGDPHLRLPPTFHVAGTNGKGSTCAFLRAMLEAQGYRVHVTTSPHLVRYNERIRLAGKLIEDAHLAALLDEVLGQVDGLNPSFFEVTIAAAFLAFSRAEADTCVVEVGLGGRFDATNVLGPEVLAACGIAALGIDHERFLLAPEDGVPTEPMARIAFEKAGIAKKGVPLVTLAPESDYPPEAAEATRIVAMQAGSPLFQRGEHWNSEPVDPLARSPASVSYVDEQGRFIVHGSALHGRHQAANLGLAIAMLRHQRRLSIGQAALATGPSKAEWPARLQRLEAGPLTGTRGIWLDGGHNPQAGAMLGEQFADQRLHLVIGMIEGKDPGSITGPLAGSLASITAVPVPGHDWHPASAFGPAARAARDVASALSALPDDGLPILIAGSLYLAGEVLRLNAELPD